MTNSDNFILNKLLTFKTNQGYFSINSSSIKAINWGINLGERFVIRMFCNDGPDFDIDYLDPDNQIFLRLLVGPHWKKYLHESHRDKLGVERAFEVFMTY